MADEQIQDGVLRVPYGATVFSIGAMVILAFCAMMGYFTLMPLIEATHPDMPRTFLIGIGGSAVLWGAFSVYIVFDHIVGLEVNIPAKRVTHTRRKFGSIVEKDVPLAPDAVVMKEVTERVMKRTPDVGYVTRIVYQLSLKNNGKVTKLYDGFEQADAERIEAFFTDNGFACVKMETPLNLWIAGGTIMFMAILFAELYMMGALN
jgi:hypothetical protein